MTVIEKFEDLAALPDGAVVLAADETAYQRSQGDWSAEGRWWHTEQIDLPVTVLWVPEVGR